MFRRSRLACCISSSFLNGATNAGGASVSAPPQAFPPRPTRPQSPQQHQQQQATHPSLDFSSRVGSGASGHTDGRNHYQHNSNTNNTGQPHRSVSNDGRPHANYNPNYNHRQQHGGRQQQHQQHYHRHGPPSTMRSPNAPSPSSSSSSSKKAPSIDAVVRGKVLRWYDEKGFGFLVDPNEPQTEAGNYKRQYFVHYRELYFGDDNDPSRDFTRAGGGGRGALQAGDVRLRRGLNVGDIVEFRKRPTEADAKLSGYDVRSVGGGPLPPYIEKPLFDPKQHFKRAK